MWGKEGDSDYKNTTGCFPLGKKIKSDGKLTSPQGRLPVHAKLHPDLNMIPINCARENSL